MLYRVKVAALLCVAALHQLLYVEAGYTLEVLVHSYTNPTSQQANGECYARDRRYQGDDDDGNGDQSGYRHCDNVFLFCLREGGHPESSEDCPLGSIWTDIIHRDDIDFGSELCVNVSNPIHFTGSTPRPDSFQLYTRIMNYENRNHAELIDKIYVVGSIIPSPSFTSAVAFIGQYSISRLTLSFRLNCTDNLYGVDCTTFCVDRDDELGHYTCDSEGNRVCREGYQDPSNNCIECTPTEGCSPENGYCTQPGECLCLEGFTGNLCEIGPDICGQGRLCLNGGTCMNSGDSGYTCLCVDGYEGTDCGVNIDDCENANCSVNSTCQDGVNSYTCDCDPGFTGEFCDSIEDGVVVQKDERGKTNQGVSDEVGGAVAGTFLGLTVTAIGVVVVIGVVLRRTRFSKPSEEEKATSSSTLVQATLVELPGDNPTVDMQPSDLQHQESRERALLQNPLYTPTGAEKTTPVHGNGLDLYGDYRDSMLLSHTVLPAVKVPDSGQSAQCLFDDTQYEYVECKH